MNSSLNASPPSPSPEPFSADNLAAATRTAQRALDHLDRIDRAEFIRSVAIALISDPAFSGEQGIKLLRGFLEKMLIKVSEMQSETGIMQAQLKEEFGLTEDLLKSRTGAPPEDPAAHDRIERWMAESVASVEDEQTREAYAILYEVVYGRRPQL